MALEKRLANMEMELQELAMACAVLRLQLTETVELLGMLGTRVFALEERFDEGLSERPETAEPSRDVPTEEIPSEPATRVEVT